MTPSWKRASGRWRARAFVAVVATGFSVLAAGCGGGSSGAGVAQISTSTTGTTTSSSSGSSAGGPAAFSECMRKNGVPNFPDPDSQGRLTLQFGRGPNGKSNGIDPSSPQFRKAQQKCRSLAPNGGRPDPEQQQRDQQAALKFSQCMRSHGLPSFPDPKFSPDGGTLMSIGKGVNPNSPVFKAALRACQKFDPGAGPPPAK